MSSWRRAVPWGVLAAGIAFSGFLLTLTRPGVFYSGDAGVKFLLVEQFARGEFHSDLRLAAVPWVRDLWAHGFYPFEPPFVYEVGDRHFACYPVPFLLLTAPAYGLLGWRGMYFWPMVGLLAAWLSLFRLCRRFDCGVAWTGLALFALEFCTPLTLYGAMYWEHTLGVALAFSGVALLVAPAAGSYRWNGFVAGLLVGLAVWFRSELVWFAAMTALLVPFARWLGAQLRGRIEYLGGLAVAGAGLVVWNVAVYGYALGFHAKHVVEGADLASRVREIAWVIPRLLYLAVRHGPVVVVACSAAVLVLALGLGNESMRGQIRLWAALGVAFVLGVAVVLPSLQFGGDGGKQFGPRYLLVMFPIACLGLALTVPVLWERASSMVRAAIGVVLALACGAGVWLNSMAGAKDLASDYRSRVVPLIEVLQANPSETVVVSHQYVAQELASQFGAKQFLLAPNEGALEQLVPALLEKGQARFLLGTFASSVEGEFRIPSRGQGPPLWLDIKRIRCTSQFCLHDVHILGAPHASGSEQYSTQDPTDQ